jgi:hypothetical protein
MAVLREVARGDDEVQLFLMVPLVRGDLASGGVLDGEPDLAARPGRDRGRFEGQRVAALGNLEPAGRGPGRRLPRRTLPRLLRGRFVGVAMPLDDWRRVHDGVHALADPVRGAEGRGERGGESGDLQSGVHGLLLTRKVVSDTLERYPHGV